jgi:phage gpG-like protein
MVEVSVFKNEHSDAEQALERLRQGMPDIDRRLRMVFGQQIVGEVQKNYLRGQVLKSSGRQGGLAGSIRAIDKSQNETMIGSYGVVYARIHELGGTIRPIHGKYLWFPASRGLTMFTKTGKLSHAKNPWRRVAWNWVRVKEVHMPKRPYLLPGITDYFASGMAEDQADRFLQKELDKRENG